MENGKENLMVIGNEKRYLKWNEKNKQVPLLFQNSKKYKAIDKE